MKRSKAKLEKGENKVGPGEGHWGQTVSCETSKKAEKKKGKQRNGKRYERKPQTKPTKNNKKNPAGGARERNGTEGGRAPHPEFWAELRPVRQGQNFGPKENFGKLGDSEKVKSLLSE